jgi:hypothetical protein
MKRGLIVAALMAVPFAAFAVQPHRAAQKAPAMDPRADQLLRGMSDYLASLKSFRVHSSAVDEVVLNNGQKIQLTSESQSSVERPNRLRSEQVGPGARLAAWYDGKTLTVYCKPSNTYGSVPAPPTLDATIDEARAKYHVEAPGADLLFSRPYEVLTEQVTGSRYIDREVIDGVACHHLAFTGKDVDWQIWIKEGNEPLPVRYEITTKTMKSQPEFSVRLSQWEPQAKLTDSEFQFQPPQGATRVATLPTKCGARQ